MAFEASSFDVRAVVRNAPLPEKDARLVRLGVAIRSQRKAMSPRLSQESLADAAKIDRSHMGKIERGERNVQIRKLLDIAEALGLPISKLFEAAKL